MSITLNLVDLDIYFNAVCHIEVMFRLSLKALGLSLDKCLFDESLVCTRFSDYCRRLKTWIIISRDAREAGIFTKRQITVYMVTIRLIQDFLGIIIGSGLLENCNEIIYNKCLLLPSEIVVFANAGDFLKSFSKYIDVIVHNNKEIIDKEEL